MFYLVLVNSPSFQNKQRRSWRAPRPHPVRMYACTGPSPGRAGNIGGWNADLEGGKLEGQPWLVAFAVVSSMTRFETRSCCGHAGSSKPQNTVSHTMSRLPVSSSEAAAGLARECCVPELAAAPGLNCTITARHEDVVGVAPY